MTAHNIIAAVRTQEDFADALLSKVSIIFDLAPDIMTLKENCREAKKSNKKLFIHLDLATGIGKDKSGILYAKSLGVDGIISTRVNIIKLAREHGLFTVQRFFIVDSQSVQTTIESAKAAQPDMIEVMPAIVTKVIEALKSSVSQPIISGGLIESEKEIKSAQNAGAYAVSTGKKELWNLM